MPGWFGVGSGLQHLADHDEKAFRTMRERLVEWLDLAANQIYDEKGMLDLSDLWQIVGVDGHPELRQRSWTPQMHPSLRPRPDDTGEQTDIFAQMRESEFLVHYPYHSFSASVERLVMCWRSR